MKSPFDELLKVDPLVRKAYEFARAAHAGQKRKSGEPYNHPVAPPKLSPTGV